MADEKKVRLRAMMTIRSTEEDEFTKNPLLPTYLVPGSKSAVFHTTPTRAKRLIAQGAAVELSPDNRKKGAPPADDFADEEALPNDFPYRAKLVSGGLNTRTAVREFPDLTKVKGIGDQAASSIQKALNELDQE